MLNKIEFVFFDSLNSFLSENLQLLSQQIICPLQSLANFKWKSDGPKTLLCHDHRGGYLDYESLCGTRICSKGSEQSAEIPFYAFFHWWHIDIFVYFSHRFVTIPPFAWTNQAHKHGVLILGTFIIENAEICQQTFSNRETIDRLIASLVHCCVVFKFVNSDCVDNLEYFLFSLRNALHDNVHKDAKIVWYDSVTTDGKLSWQNALNANNLRWFKSVDAFYTNYAWKEEHIQQTVRTFLSNSELFPSKSLFDVFVGIDVFGRGCLGDGGWNCVQPMEILRRFALSAAIFAPGWICEMFSGQSHRILFDNSFRFWNALSTFLYPHALRQRNIRTDFAVAFESERPNLHFSQLAENETGENHFCLQNADLQPFYGCSAAFAKDMEAGLLVKGTGIHKLFICDIPIEEKDEKIELRFDCSHPIGLIVTVSDGIESLNFCQHSFDDNQSDETNKRHEKSIVFDVGGKRGWKISDISIFNTMTVPIRLYTVHMNLY
ncbi:hypothetical protein niasHT_004648 [Heterodera trifolii]|uniref:Cytosolic endo-beta-N-acetylglucosaminidase TIM barrel domain-containing protein n=1 Tax=Heterodera trifolii TaxID=157864 RepID=A0ABD2MCG2_9BILA